MSRGICEHQAKLLYIVLFLNPKNRPKPRLGATSSVSTKKWAFPGFGSVLESLNPALGQAAAHPITYSLLSAYGIQLNPTCRESIILSLENDGVFLLHSPRIASIQILRRSVVRRAKLYYLRKRMGKATRLKQRFT